MYCRSLLDHDVSRLLAAAERYDDAGRPLLTAKALEAAAVPFIHVGDHVPAQDTFTRAVEAYTSLGAAADVAGCRPRSAPAASGAGHANKPDASLTSMRH